jgi:hypothetical protein
MTGILTKRTHTAVLELLLATLSVALLVRDARADGQGPPMVWRHDISDPVEKSRIEKYGVGPYADAQTRLETELRTDIDLARLPEAKAAMDRLVADGAAAAKVFGKNHRVVAMAKRPRKVWDLYLDTTDGRLAASGASLRIRIENGTAQINYKPPTGNYFSDGMKIGMEAGITLQADKRTGKLPNETIAFFKNTRLIDNPLREMKKQFPDLALEDFFFLQLENKQDRQMYAVEELDGAGQWVKKSEISVDLVVGRDPRNRATQVRYGRVELEGDHVSAGQLNARQQAALAGSDWKGPHKANDTRDPRFAASDEVTKIRGYGVALQGYLKVKPSKGSKYVRSRELLAAKGVTFDRGKLMVKGLYRTRARNKPVRVSQRRAAARPIKSARR